MKKDYRIAIACGVCASTILLILYGSILTFVSGFMFAVTQWQAFWPYIASLSVGFGIQVSLFTFLHRQLHGHSGGGVMAASGTTSTAAMVSCCTHYLVNLLPVLGATGLVTFVTQYQIQLFWLGIVANLAGISYMIYKIKTILYV